MSIAVARGTSCSRPIVAEVVRQHVELAACLWAQRDTLSLGDPVDVETIGEIDHRVEANLDGLRIAGPAAWDAAGTVVGDFPEKGELFVSGWMALEQSDIRRFENTVELARRLDRPRGLIGALAWHSLAKVGSVLREWLDGQDSFKRYLSLTACVEHRVDPKQWLDRLIGDADPRVRTVALRLAGMLKRVDLLELIAEALGASDAGVRLWAGWAMTQLDRGASARFELRMAAVADGPDALTALRAAVKAGSEQHVRSWLGALMRVSATAPVAVRGVGMLGDQSVLGWLIERMHEPHVAVAATAAFLELFPDARRETKLFTSDPEEVGPAFAGWPEAGTLLALPAAVELWRRQNHVTAG